MKRTVISIARNWKGKSWGKQQVVFECDDWGSLGVPSTHTTNQLKEKGLKKLEDRFQRIDALERSQDIEMLLESLTLFRDKNGNHPIFSCFFNVANPDFDKIKKDEFNQYSFIDLEKTYNIYSDGKKAKSILFEGIKAGLIAPEFHGREHLAVEMWLRALRSGDKFLNDAFNHEFLPYSPFGTHPLADKFRAKFFSETLGDVSEQAHSIVEGLQLFKDFFGIKAQVFNAPNGVFCPNLNSNLISEGISVSAVPFVRKEWVPNQGFYNQKHYLGEKSKDGMSYYVRNCNFEPGDSSYLGVKHVLDQVAGAFMVGKPAIIGTHRINFVGGISSENQKYGLNQLKLLLSALLEKWPNLEFSSSSKIASQLYEKDLD